MDATKPSRSLVAARVAQACSLSFLAVLALLHALEPEFDPRWRMISEYSLGAWGWLMRAAFLCWAASVLATLTALTPSLREARAHVVRGWMIALSLALVGAALWNTNPILDQTPRLSHRLHQLCGSVVILTFPFMATACIRALRRAAPSEPMPLRGVTAATWAGVLSFFVTIAVSRAMHPELGRAGPHVLMGVPNRLLVVTYQLWLFFAARYATQRRTQPLPSRAA